MTTTTTNGHVTREDVADLMDDHAETSPVTPITAPEPAPKAGRSRPVVMLEPDLGDMEDVLARQVHRINAEGRNPVLYHNGESIVEVARDRRDGGYRLREVSVAAFRSILSKACRFRKINAKGDVVAAKLPLADVAGLYDRAHVLDLPYLTRFTQCPLFDAEGRLHVRPGYVPEVGAFIHYPDDTDPMPEVDERPTQEQAQRAAQWIIRELLGDFLFAADHGHAAVLGFMLSPLVGAMINGPRPVLALDAPEAGSGKTLLGRVALTHVIPHVELSIAPDRMEEFEKSLVAQARKGRAVIAFDNLNTFAESGVFASAITGYPTWEARVLGASEMIKFTAPDAWLITGNGIKLSEENARRTLIVRINPHDVDHSDWRHPNILQWAYRHRGQIQAALVTMVRAWLAAGQPSPSSCALRSFEAWARVIGGILEYAGVAGLLRNVPDDYADPERAGWAQFAHALLACQEEGLVPEKGATAGQLLEALGKAHASGLIDELPPVLDRWTEPKAFGKELQERRGKRLDREAGLTLTVTSGRARSQYYRIVRQ